MNRPRSRFLIAVSMLVGSLACEPSSACDPGYFEDHGACYANPTQPSDAGSAGDDADTTDATVNRYEGFGRSCTHHEDCPATASACGAPSFPICTMVNCQGDPLACPPTWSCIDVSKLSGDPTVKSACVEF